MKIIYAYLKTYKKQFLVLIAFYVIFLTVFTLNKVDVSVVNYGLFLATLFLLIVIILDFFSYYKKYKLLKNLKKSVFFDTTQLPQTNTLIEKQYQTLINILYDEKTKNESMHETEKNDMLDYYTLWVHQIKTPISAMSFTLQQDKTTQGIMLANQLFSIEQYVNFVLGYIRLNSTSTDYIFKKHSLQKIVQQSIRKYSKTFIQNKIALDFKPFALQAVTDDKWLEFAIEQILSNALKYTNKGKISIYSQGNTLVIADTGIGIAQSDIPRLFEKGYTGYNGHYDKKASGLGLYLTKQVLNKLSHNIQITSTVNIGTKVVIDFTPLQ